MQPQVEGSCSDKTLGKLLEPASGDKQPGSFLIDLRKMAFEDAFQLSFPVRAGAVNAVACQLLQVWSVVICIHHRTRFQLIPYPILS
ncbi:hypothetical protein J1N35_024072 [Gossypium stocksii]|uniref:Uncharacterized protein n=1 Tax=Gossypium stocksii TaxID=47602 RepID=A0A9D3VK10_9ROSI|nr:hypothetical protein J1N35_024072 [Gossypium stocksii]